MRRFRRPSPASRRSHREPPPVARTAVRAAFARGDGHAPRGPARSCAGAARGRGRGGASIAPAPRWTGRRAGRRAARQAGPAKVASPSSRRMKSRSVWPGEPLEGEQPAIAPGAVAARDREVRAELVVDLADLERAPRLHDLEVDVAVPGPNLEAPSRSVEHELVALEPSAAPPPGGWAGRRAA